MKKIAFLTIINFVYLLFSGWFFFIAYEYLSGIISNPSYFRITHSFRDNALDIVFFILWCTTSIIVFKLNSKKYTK